MQPSGCLFVRSKKWVDDGWRTDGVRVGLPEPTSCRVVRGLNGFPSPVHAFVGGFPWANGILTGRRLLMRATDPGRSGAYLNSTSSPHGVVRPWGRGLGSLVLSADCRAFLLCRTGRT